MTSKVGQGWRHGHGHAVDRAIVVEDVGVAVLNLMSDNRGMRWDIEITKRMIGYAPQDGAVAGRDGAG